MLRVTGLKAHGLSCGKIILFIRPIILFYLVLVCFSSRRAPGMCSSGRDAGDFPFMCERVVTPSIRMGEIRAAAISKNKRKKKKKTGNQAT